MARDSWSGDEVDAPVRRVVQGLIRLAESEEAGRILGVDGTLEDEIDLLFLSEPLEWIASEIANALRQAEQDEEEEEDAEETEASDGGSVSLSTAVALLRLYRIATGQKIEERALVEAVVEYLNEE
ncbi:MAG TPA: hypothetical protein VFX49_04820 [Chloroflexota bacterium]|nr:hypothetical protein [Chloroflexota bacterium]